MSTIYIEAQAVRAAIELLKIDVPDLAEDAQLMADMIEGETDLDKVLTKVVRQEQETSQLVDALVDYIKDLAARKSRFSRKSDMLRSLAASLLNAAGQQKVVLPDATLSLSRHSPRPVIDDEAQLPDALCKWKRSPDMAAIFTALGSGDSVPGAHLSNGSISLSIRIR